MSREMSEIKEEASIRRKEMLIEFMAFTGSLRSFAKTKNLTAARVSQIIIKAKKEFPELAELA